MSHELCIYFRQHDTMALTIYTPESLDLSEVHLSNIRPLSSENKTQLVRPVVGRDAPGLRLKTPVLYTPTGFYTTPSGVKGIRVTFPEYPVNAFKDFLRHLDERFMNVAAKHAQEWFGPDAECTGEYIRKHRYQPMLQRDSKGDEDDTYIHFKIMVQFHCKKPMRLIAQDGTLLSAIQSEFEEEVKPWTQFRAVIHLTALWIINGKLCPVWRLEELAVETRGNYWDEDMWDMRRSMEILDNAL